MDPLNVSEPDEPLSERREDGIHEDIEPRPENTDKEENGADEETEPSRRENRSNERFIVTTEDGEGIKLVTTIKNVRGLKIIYMVHSTGCENVTSSLAAKMFI